MGNSCFVRIFRAMVGIMTTTNCWSCDKPGSASTAGSILCPECRSITDEYLCARCGQNCVVSKETPHGDVCSTCIFSARAALIPRKLLEPIQREVKAGRCIQAIVLARETLKWSLLDCKELAAHIKQNLEDEPPCSS